MFGSKTYCAFGTFATVPGTKAILLHFEGSSIAKQIGSDQERHIVHLTVDELKYINPVTAVGTSAEVLWKRIT